MKENETLCEHFITEYIYQAHCMLSVEEIDVSAPIETCANIKRTFRIRKTVCLIQH